MGVWGTLVNVLVSVTDSGHSPNHVHGLCCDHFEDEIMMNFMTALMHSFGKSEPKFSRPSLSFSFLKSKLLDPTSTWAHCPLKPLSWQNTSAKCRINAEIFSKPEFWHWLRDRLAIFENQF